LPPLNNHVGHSPPIIIYMRIAKEFSLKFYKKMTFLLMQGRVRMHIKVMFSSSRVLLQGLTRTKLSRITPAEFVSKVLLEVYLFNIN